MNLTKMQLTARVLSGSRLTGGLGHTRWFLGSFPRSFLRYRRRRYHPDRRFQLIQSL